MLVLAVLCSLNLVVGVQVKSMKKKLRDFKAQQTAIMRLSRPTRGYTDHNKDHGANAGYQHAKPTPKLQVPPTFRTKLYGPRKTIGHAKEQLRIQARKKARDRAAKTQSTIKKMNSELVRHINARLH